MFGSLLSLEFFGELENYTFLETRLHEQSENQCFHLHRCLHGGHLGFFKMASVKRGFCNFSASKQARTLILTAKHTFSGARNPMTIK